MYGHWKTVEFDITQIVAFVYQMTCVETQQQYIGVKKVWVKIQQTPVPPLATETNWRKYTSSSSLVNNMITQGYTFNYEIIEVFSDWSSACDKEHSLLREYNVLNNDMYLNRSIGIPYGVGDNHPMFGRHHTKQTREKISRKRNGQTHTQETCDIISKARTDVPRLQATKDKISVANTGKTHTIGTRAELRRKKSVGEYHTPHGIFCSSYEAAEHIGCSDRVVRYRCATTSAKFRDWMFIPFN